MNQPLVSVICLCYNHKAFLHEAIGSVVGQTYPNLQLILVDDASSDGSAGVIQELAAKYTQIQSILLPANLGNCKAFNVGLAQAKGEFIIDFATDDVMLPDRIANQVDFFFKRDFRTGVVFTDAIYIDEFSKPFRKHFDYLKEKKLIDHIPSGEVFRDVLTTYFICSPTMMIRREVLTALNGYDETLAYEDFDFWVRASRLYEFALLNEPLTLVRKSLGSMSSGWYKKGDLQLHSTYLICCKARELCRNEDDVMALRHRVLYEFRQSVFSENKVEANLFSQLLKSLGRVPKSFYAVRGASFLPLPWSWMRTVYHRIFYG
jgi:glycosyltransferase involved in cell wall biosynthesis